MKNQNDFINNTRIVKSIVLLMTVLLFNGCGDSKERSHETGKNNKVELEKSDEGFNLYLGEEPYFIKGARTLGTRYMEEVAKYGGNSVRVGFHSIDTVLDKAENLGLTVLFGLPVKAQRSGFNYDDEEAVQEQFNRMKKTVKKYKDHPAVLMWVIGNELDHIPGRETYNKKVWDAVNDIAEMIHKVDPDHPAMTVIGTGRKEKLKDIKERCPDIDLLGINSYADIFEVPDWLRKYNWNKPYVVTEWGPSGHWQVPKTKWGVAIEETSTEKADLYRKKYEKVIQGDPMCVGSYAFLWTSRRQERTHTWYNMFFRNGLEKEAVEVMQYMWTCEWPDNRSPRIESITIGGKEAEEDVSVAAGSINPAKVVASDPDSDELQIEWNLLPVPEEFGAYAGQGETMPEPVKGFVKSEESGQILFEVPHKEGRNYRLFVYVYDDHGHVAVGNVPFYVRNAEK
ncbi:MAG: glycoside hydrolase family 2 TIM barrel-domain containing protein [bacterium]